MYVRMNEIVILAWRRIVVKRAIYLLQPNAQQETKEKNVMKYCLKVHHYGIAEQDILAVF
ncbi:hypothetical protein HanIR_Chr03g0104501 [Helianthus annuus]|nr:hypothetical protein HanIR_Chr03g0104501 [Helianthus annuus]